MSKNTTAAPAGQKILSINQRRWKKFQTIRRGYWSLIILTTLYLLSFALPLMINNKALYVSYNGTSYFPAVRDFFDIPGIGAIAGPPFISGETLGQVGNKAECIYRDLQKQYEAEGGANTVIMPIYPFSPIEDISVSGNEPFCAPFATKGSSLPRPMGTDDRGRDVLARMTYGFQTSMSFALLVALIEYLIGIPIGAFMGYFGGKFDLIMQRFIEIWQSLPFLFLIIILVSIFRPSFFLLVCILSAFAWISIAAQMRAQYYREKTRDYVSAAVSIGVPTWRILVKHILPNTLVPIITFLPFAIVGGIGALVSLEFLGFGLAPPTPSWGEMVGVGLREITSGYWWMVLVPLGAMFTTLLLVVFIGEAVREAFDPKTFSRLR